MWFPLVNYFKDTYHAVVVFDVLDEFSGFSNAHPDIKKFEEQMTGIADYFICTSRKIYEGLKSKKNNVQLIPNAVEFNFFNRLPKNKLLKDLAKPIIGYYGAIAEWFDIGLIEFIARQKPGWNIVLIGHTFGAALNRLEQFANVHLLGEKPYDSLPGYLYWFDVCLIPFKLSDLILSCNPVKFYEYISSGKPVVSTNLPEIHPYSDIVYLATGKEEFLEKIQLALKENDVKIRKKRINTAKKNDWNQRLEEIESVVKKTFPKVSIIIVTFNNKPYTELCLESILAKTAYPNYEIIILDNASTDGTGQYLKKLQKTNPRVKIIFNDKNNGFSKANNQGIAAAEGSYLILLNSDTMVTRGWMGGLIKHFKDSRVGMVCPVTNNIGNEARININYLDLNYMDFFAEKYTRSHLNESFEINGCAMFCVAIPTAVVKKVGLLDERFGIGTFEDDDYSFRIKNAGYKLLCVEDVFIHHFGNVSFQQLGEGKYQRVMEENLKKFEEKWRCQWVGHQYRKGVSGVPYVMPKNIFKFCYSTYKKNLGP
jgi:GT2 family glycosyltransferase